MSDWRAGILFSFCLLANAASLACGGGDDDDGGDDGAAEGDASTADAHGDHEDHGDHGEEDEFEEVPCTATHPKLSQGVSGKLGELAFEVVASDPAAARQKVANDWTVEVVDGEGMPVEDVKVTAPVAAMMVHPGHTAKPAPKVAEGERAGTFELDDVYFTMRGPWEVTFQVEAGDARGAVTLNVCVE